MNILSFTELVEGGHDSSAAIVCDGELVAAAEEERFSRQKHDSALPLSAIRFCLEYAGLSMREIDAIAFPDKPFRTGSDSPLREMNLAFISRLKDLGGIRKRSIIHKIILDAYFACGLPSFNLGLNQVIAQGTVALREHYPELPPIRYYDHHMAHAAAAFYNSPFESAAVATVDGRGGHFSSVIWSADAHRISRIAAEPYLNSLGSFFRDCTRYLALGEFGEGKLMGLAGYGDKAIFDKHVSSILDRSGTGWYEYRQPPAEEVLGFSPRTTKSITDPLYANFAASCQDALEKAMRRIASSAIEHTRSENLCLGGGVALNCSSNGSLLAAELTESLWVFPAAGDAGLSVGAALLCAADVGELQRRNLPTAYLGPEFSSAACEVALRCEPGVVYRRTEQLLDEVAGALSSGKVVGWFQGRMEFGPRALGNRSILADPRTLEMRDRVNRLKGRECWRPLAPVVLAEHASEFFTIDVPSPFMLFATKVRLQRRSAIPAVVHIDGSARPQTVTREQNPLLYKLLLAFQQRTDVPVLLNTSFNSAEEPIVCTPKDAINTFLTIGLDLLVLGDWLVSRKVSNG